MTLYCKLVYACLPGYLTTYLSPVSLYYTIAHPSAAIGLLYFIIQSAVDDYGFSLSDAVVCRSTQFLCQSSQKCINADWKCDGDLDCASGEDEKDCGNST